ncbi:dihydropteroate synthase [Megamonas hypermegale]|uniref:dihydropteroate synthase n=1 Tax=Megamonas hypermegale TaxID=158847 RepID=UPI0026EE0D41|nr:dihydropteroate synthase [Megamonas hypermegale]
MQIGTKNFDVENCTYIMGILNVTPDSFSDGGRFNSLDRAMQHAQQMIDEGVDIIDVGGESTRPGYTLLSDEEEISRIVPVIEKLKANFDVLVSLDTYKGKVAQAGIAAGADLINDIWGLKYDDILAKVIAENDVACCLMHNRDNTDYEDFLAGVIDDMRETVEIARSAGIKDEKIILDPGIGFGKTYEQNLIMLNNLNVLEKFGYPLLLGASRKSVIGNALNLPVSERLEGTIATSVLAVMSGYAFVRVHDVKENKRAVEMALAVRNSGRRYNF